MNDTVLIVERWATALLPAMLDAAVKGAVLLAAAWMVVALMRKASAASRQLVWLLALAGLLALPVVSALAPSWQVLPGWAKVAVPAPAQQGDKDRHRGTACEIAPGPGRGSPFGAVRRRQRPRRNGRDV